MDCFRNLIQVRDLCNVPLPKSGIYVDDVGVSLNDIEAFITYQYNNAADYFNARVDHAVREMTNTIYNYFQGQYNATSLVDSHRLGVYNGSTLLKPGANYRGIQMLFNQSDTFFKVSIGEVSLLVDQTTTVTVEVWDLRQNKLLDQIDIATVAGQISTGYLHKSFDSSKQPLNLFIGYDASSIGSYYTQIKSGLCCGKISCNNSYVSAYGVEVDGAFYDANATGINHTSGLSVVYDIACDHKSWICSHAESLALPLAYKTAEILVSDAAYNTSGERSTNHHTVNIDDLKERLAFYERKYKEVMTNWLSNMQVPNNRCFQCNTPVRHKIMLP
jgi:hypothetical protein